MSEPKQLTIRNPSPELSRRLRAMSEARGESVNTTVLRLLELSVGLTARREWLKRFASWSTADLAEFQDSLRSMRAVDEKLWR